MRTILITIIALLLFSSLKSSASYQNRFHRHDSVYVIVDVMPEFKGGSKALDQFIKDNQKYPDQGQKIGFSAKVFITFIINKEGNIVNPEIVRTTFRVPPGNEAGHSALIENLIQYTESEAMRLIRLSPNWNPGINNKKTVDVSTSISFVFEPKR